MSLRNMKSLNFFVLDDQVLWLNRRRGIELSGSEGYFGSENVLFEEILLDELFQVLLEDPTVDGLVPLVVTIGAIFFCSGSGIVPD